MSHLPHNCRLCGSENILDCGAIPDGDYFAGRVLAKALCGGRLVRCASCNSMFRHPVLTPAQYIHLYKNALPEHWRVTPAREDLRVVASLIASGHEIELRILDVGCGAGDFLDALPPAFRKFGVEPSEAAGRAALRGIKIVARQIDDIPADEIFDVITIIDVIEHVVDPSSLLLAAYRHLKPGGKIVISSGNPQTPVWQGLFKSRFWYVSFPEHITFPSVGYYRAWCGRYGAVCRQERLIHYQRLGHWRRVANLAMQIGYYLSPTLFSWVGRTGMRLIPSNFPRRRTYSPGIPGLFADHHIVILLRPRCQGAENRKSA